MMNSNYHFERLRKHIEDYESSRERALVYTKLDEAELWLSRCKLTPEAIKRDQSNL